MDKNSSAATSVAVSTTSNSAGEWANEATIQMLLVVVVLLTVVLMAFVLLTALALVVGRKMLTRYKLHLRGTASWQLQSNESFMPNGAVRRGISLSSQTEPLINAAQERDAYAGSATVSELLMSTQPLHTWSAAVFANYRQATARGGDYLINLLSDDEHRDCWDELRRRKAIFELPPLKICVHVLQPVMNIGERAWLVFAWPTEGPLETYLQSGSQDEHELVALAEQLVQGLIALHDSGISARNLRVGTVLVYRQCDSQQVICKLSAFDETHQSIDQCLRPPEGVAAASSVSADIWLFGALLWQMYMIKKERSLPASEQTWRWMTIANVPLQTLLICCEVVVITAINAIIRCLNPTPAHRPKARDLSLVLSNYDVPNLPTDNLLSRGMVDKCDLKGVYPMSGSTKVVFAQLQSEQVVVKKYANPHEFRRRWTIFQRPDICRLDAATAPLLVPLVGVIGQPWLVFRLAKSNLELFVKEQLALRGSLDNILDYGSQILNGLALLHRLNLLVRNLHIGAVLVFGNDRRPVLQLSGYDNTECRINRRCRAPELYVSLTAPTTTHSDIWAFGVTVMQVMRLVAGIDEYDWVFPDKQAPELMGRRCAPILSPPVEHMNLTQIYALVIPCFDYEPQNRPTAEVLLSRFRPNGSASSLLS